MNPQDVFVKTEKGREEILTGKSKLGPALRTLLVMSDGSTTAGEILSQLSRLAIPPEAFDQLFEEGFIAKEEPAPSPQAPAGVPAEPPVSRESEEERFSVARRLMNETAANAAGLRSFFFRLKLEKSESLEDLEALLGDYTKLVEKGTGKAEAEVLVNKVKELIR